MKSSAGDADEVNDLRFDGAFPNPSEYLVEVTDVGGDGGPAFAYSWEALDGAPDFILTATPDAPNVQPGFLDAEFSSVPSAATT